MRAGITLCNRGRIDNDDASVCEFVCVHRLKEDRCLIRILFIIYWDPVEEARRLHIWSHQAKLQS